MGNGFWIFFLACAALSVPMTLAGFLSVSRQRRIDALRRHDPHLASEIEQVYYGINPATLPMRDRAFEKPRHPTQY
jgi:hypothetical protein